MESTPIVSVVIPVYNDPVGVAETLDSLVDQEYPTEAYEILVVDNNSTDETPETIEEYAADFETVTALSEDTIQSSYAARNRGIQNSTGDVIALIDADITVEPDWIEAGIQSMQAQDADYLACDVVVEKQSESIFAEYSYQTEFPIGLFVEKDNFGGAGNIFVKREVFEDVRLFDHSLISGGDFEFGNRVSEAGYTIHFDPSITMYHPARSSFSAHWSKHGRIGAGKAQLRARHPDLTSSVFHPRNFLPSTPSYFMRQLHAKQELTWVQLLQLFIISYTMKLRRAVSGVHHHVSKKSS